MTSDCARQRAWFIWGMLHALGVNIDYPERHEIEEWYFLRVVGDAEITSTLIVGCEHLVWLEMDWWPNSEGSSHNPNLPLLRGEIGLVKLFARENVHWANCGKEEHGE